MKKSLLLLILLSMAVAVSACNGPDVTNITTKNSNAKQETESSETAVKEINSSKSITDNKTPDELVSMEPTETIGEHIQQKQDKQTDIEQPSNSSNDNSQSAPEETAFPGPDTAMLVNLRGDTTTVYKLADGRYMDRTNSVYIFDGVDTWTDESSVEWNETAQISEAEENVQDPYNLYSWDPETGTYIPYQQAEGNGEPIGRGNGWYYYDEEAGAYIPW